MNDNSIELQAPSSITEASQDTIFSSIQEIEKCEYISEEDKYHCNYLLTKFLNKKPNSENIPKDLLYHIGYSLNDHHFDSIKEELVNDLNDKDIALLMFLHIQGVKLNEILKDKWIFSYNLNDVSQFTNFLKEWDLDINDVFTCHPQFLSDTQDNIIEKIKKERSTNLLSEEETKMIQSLEEEIIGNFIYESSSYKINNYYHRVLDLKEVDELFLKYYKTFGSLHKKEEKDLVKEQIETLLILYNQRLVVSRSRLYTAIMILQQGTREIIRNKEDYEDVIQDGNLGLLKAIRRYDIGQAKAFSTFATRCVDSAIRNNDLNRTNIIKIEPAILPDIKIIRENRDILEGLGVADPSFDKIVQYCQEKGITFKNKIENIKSGWEVKVIMNLNEDLENEEEEIDEIIEYIPSSKNTPENEYIRKERINRLNSAIDELDRRESTILINRKGLGIVEKQTLSTLAKFFGISREMIRQIEKKAVTKLIPKLEEIYAT